MIVQNFFVTFREADYYTANKVTIIFFFLNLLYIIVATFVKKRKILYFFYDLLAIETPIIVSVENVRMT